MHSLATTWPMGMRRCKHCSPGFAMPRSSWRSRRCSHERDRRRRGRDGWTSRCRQWRSGRSLWHRLVWGRPPITWAQHACCRAHWGTSAQSTRTAVPLHRALCDRQRTTQPLHVFEFLQRPRRLHRRAREITANQSMMGRGLRALHKVLCSERPRMVSSSSPTSPAP